MNQQSAKVDEPARFMMPKRLRLIRPIEANKPTDEAKAQGQ